MYTVTFAILPYDILGGDDHFLTRMSRTAGKVDTIIIPEVWFYELARGDITPAYFTALLVGESYHTNNYSDSVGKKKPADEREAQRLMHNWLDEQPNWYSGQFFFINMFYRVYHGGTLYDIAAEGAK